LSKASVFLSGVVVGFIVAFLVIFYVLHWGKNLDKKVPPVETVYIYPEKTKSPEPVIPWYPPPQYTKSPSPDPESTLGPDKAFAYERQ
jgi:hypothetical protein